ncbi:MAG: response regulator [Bacteroidales bacterium]|nr:response regulator [Bacteroidales bacterium]
MKRHIALILVFFLSTSFLISQPYTIRRLGVEHGLSNNHVVSITQDQQGFLWFATEEGLNKFDGTRFISFYKDAEATPEKQGITGNELNKVWADPNRPLIWIATQRDGLNAYNYQSQTFTVYQNEADNPESLITNDVTDFSSSTESPDGLWISTYYRGIDYLDISTGKFTHYNKTTIPDLVSEQTWTVVDGGDGFLYIGHVNSGFSVLSLQDRSIINFQNIPEDDTSLPGNEVRAILKDSNGNIWLGTDGGLALYNSVTQDFITFRQSLNNKQRTLSSRIFSIKQSSNNQLWITSEFNGIAILDMKKSQFISPEHFNFEFIRDGDDSQALSNASVRCVFEDSYKNIWIGTWGGGINFISSTPPLFSTIDYSPYRNAKNKLNNKVVSSICTDKEGNLWFGTDGGGINVFEDNERIAVYKKDSGELKANSVLAAFRDSKNNLWFGTFLGSVSLYNGQTKRFQSIFPMGITNLDVRTFYEDNQRRIWMGSNKGIYVYDMNKMEIICHYHTGNSDLQGNLIRSIIQDEKGRFWVGTFGDGLAIYSPDFKLVKNFIRREGFCSNTINHIYQDSQKRVWVATGEGLVCFDSSNDLSHKTYRRKDGLINTHIKAITEDQEGNIWFSSNNGIGCFVNEQKNFLYYDHAYDVPLGGFMSGSVAQNMEGQIYFGSNNGVCYFMPDIVKSEFKTPPVLITEMKIFNQLNRQERRETIIPLTKEQIELTHKQSTFSLVFNIQNYSYVHQMEYAYMLKGLENSWYTVDESNSVTFRNIPPGKYEFYVKGRIKNQEWADEITTLAIHINPPLWLTWWAKLIYFLVSIAIVYFILYAYKKKLDVENLYVIEKKNHEQEHILNQERLRFFTNITHELRTPLTLILGPLEDMLKEGTIPPKQNHKLSIIHKSALRLLNLINQILEFRKTETQNKKLCVSKENITLLIYEVGLKYKELNQNNKIDFQIQVEKEEMVLFFDKEIISIILDNLISNAFKYTEQGTIELSLYQTIRNKIAYTEIKVSDSGHGIKEEALSNIFNRYYQESGKHQASGTGIGLALVKNLVELHEGEIRVESEVNKGSSFYISLLTENVYPNSLHSDASEEENNSEYKEEDFSKDQVMTINNERPILLIVEDNKDIRNYIADSFSDSFEIITANNGEEGKNQALNNIPDIIVSDIMMPVMDGITLCHQLKKDVRTSHIPIILLTAKNAIQDKEEGYEVGADSYLTKPFSASLLHSRINNLLESRKKMAEQFQLTYSDKIQIKEKQSIITDSLSKLDNEFIEKVTQLIEDNLSSEKFDITYLSDKMHMSNSTLYRKVKALTGLSTNEYIRKIKMKNAEELLLEGKYNISEIAYKVGINSVGYFRQCFKEEFGVSPSDYLKQIMEK